MRNHFNWCRLYIVIGTGYTSSNMADSMHRETEPRDYRFRFSSGRLCLDLLATVADRAHLAYDRWRTAGDLGRWCVESGLLSAAPRSTGAQLGQARRLRESLYRVVQAGRAGQRPEPQDLDLVNRWAARPPLVPRLEADGRTRTLSGAPPLDAVLATAARDAVDLLAGPGLDKVKVCAEDSCSILFVDSSRPGKRRWCSMSICGNKIKKAAYRKRHSGKADH